MARLQARSHSSPVAASGGGMGRTTAGRQQIANLPRQRERMTAHGERRRKGSVQVLVDVSREQIARRERASG